MFSYLLRQERAGLSLAALTLVLVGFLAPDETGPRTWLFLGASLLLPALLIGRMQRRAAAGWLEEACSAPGAGRLYLFDCILGVATAVLLGVLGGAGDLSATVALTAWCLAITCFADLLDRALPDPRVAWLILGGSVVVWLTSPLWLAPLFGRTGLAPWLATWSIGLHPATVVLAAFEQPTLQDPVLYRLTLSGVVEVRPLWWGWGALTYLIAFIGSAVLCFFVRRRPLNSLLG